MITTLAIYMPGWPEMLVIGLIALLIFGKRLPEVGKSLGQSMIEFKKGLKGVEDEVDDVKREIDSAAAQDSDDSRKLT